STATVAARRAERRTKKCRSKSRLPGCASRVVSCGSELHAGREDVVAFDGDFNAWQRSTRRARDRPTLGDFKMPVVAWAHQFVPREVRYDRAGEVRAFLPVSHNAIAAEPNQQARIVVRRITKADHALRAQIR